MTEEAISGHAGPAPDGAAIGAAKQRIRARVLAHRRALTSDQVAAAGTSIRAMALDLPAVAAADAVALYVATGTEPGTRDLLADLHARGTRVLLPVLRPDLDLDWAEYTGDLVAGPRGTLEPAGPRLGPDAIAAADAVLVPALAVGRRGERLGRGGGSYDRALRRARPGAPVIALVYPDELMDTLPVAAHDARVDVALTPQGRHDLRAPGLPRC